MSNAVVTELIVDARGAEQGTALYLRAMQAAQAGADRVIDREQKMAAAREKSTAALVGGASSLTASTRAWEKLRASADPAVAMMKRIEQAQLAADAAVRRGNATEEEATRVLGLYVDGLKRTSIAAREAARDVDALARQDLGNVAKVDAYLANIAREAGELTRAMNPLLVAQERYNSSLDQANRLARQSLISEETRRAAIAASQRALEAAGRSTGDAPSRLQAGLDLASSIRHSGGSARESAAVFEEDARQMAALQREAAELQAKIDPLGAAYSRLTAELARYDDMAARQVITDGQLVAFKGHATKAFDDYAEGMGLVAGRAKLTAEQVKNLGFQVNDAATMLASGSSLMQVIATQGGQVYQALDGPKGVKGSLKAIGTSALDFATSLGPAGIAIAALAAGAGAFAFAVRRDVEPVEDVIDRQTQAVKRLRAAYGMTGQATSDFAQRTRKAVTAEQRETYETDLKSLRDRVVNLGSDFFSGQPNAARRENASFEPIRKAFMDLQASARAGIPDFAAFGEQLERIAEVDPTTGFFGGHPVRDLAKEMGKAAIDGKSLQETLQDLGNALSGVARSAELGKAALKAARDDMAAFLPAAKTQAEQIEEIYARQIGAIGLGGGDDRDIQSATRKALADRKKAIDELSRGSREAAKEAQDRLANLSLSPDQRSLAEIRQHADAEIAAARLVSGDKTDITSIELKRDAELAAAENEIKRAEDARRAGNALDLQAVTARTAAQRAEIDGERARVAYIAEGHSKAEAALEGERVSALSLAQAREQVAEAGRQNEIATQRQVEQAQLEYDLVGKSAGEVARLRTEFDLLAQAKDAARSAGFDESTVQLTDAMRAQAAQIGELTAATERLNFQRDLLFERQQAGRSPEDQEIASRLRSMGVEYDSAQGRLDAAQLRFNARLKESSELLQDMGQAGKDAFFDIVNAIGSGEDAMDAFTKAFAGIGKQLASQGFDQIFGGLFGTGTTAGAPSAGAGAGSAFGRVGQTFAAPATVPVTRAPLPPLVTGEGFSASQAANVAGKSVPAQMWNFFANKGLSSVQIAGIMGNAKVESGFNPGISGDAGKALGLFQWNDRAAKMKAFVGDDWKTDVQGQLEFAWHEFQTTEHDSFSKLLKATSIKGATEAVLGFERPSGYPTGVQNSSHYDRRIAAANASYEGYSDPRAISEGVSDGMVTYSRKVAAGAVPKPSDPPMNRGGGGADLGLGGGGGVSNLGAGMQALGSGIGIFSQGYESGSPFGGAINGAMGGWSAGAALGASGLGASLGLGAMGGPIGMGVGLLVGLMGGILGKSKQKKEQKKQEQAQARQAWEQNLPALHDLEDQVNRVRRGALSEEIEGIDEKLVQFGDLAGKTGRKADTKTVAGLQTAADNYRRFLTDQFRSAFQPIIADIADGYGLDTDFTKARDNVKATADQYLGFISDVKLAYKIEDDPTETINRTYEAAIKDIEAAKAQGDALRAAMLSEQATNRGSGSNNNQAEIAYNDFMARKNIDSGDYTAMGRVAVSSGLEVIGNDIRVGGTSDTTKITNAADERDAAIKAWEEANKVTIDEANKAIADAYDAARKGLLALVSGDVKEKSDVERALDQSAGAAVGLNQALLDLGETADEAKTAIDAAIAKRRDTLKESFVQGINDSLEGMDGKSYLADFRSLQKQRESMLADAKLLDVDPELITRYFKASAQSIVDSADLTGDAFADLIKVFPELTDVVTQATSSLEEIKDRIQGYDDRTFAAQTDTSTEAGRLADFDRSAAREREAEAKAGGGAMVELERALAAERLRITSDFAKSAAEEAKQAADALSGALVSFRSDALADATQKRADAESNLLNAFHESEDHLTSFSKQVKAFLTNIRLGDASPLSGRDQFLEAQASFRDLQAKAMGGDKDAQEQLVDVSQSYLDEARAYYASSEGYFDAFNEVEGALKSADAKATSQLDVLRQQVGSLVKIEANTLSIADAITALTAAIAVQKAAQAAVDQGRTYGVNTDRNRLIDAGVKGLGLSYSGNYGFAADGSDPFRAWRESLPADQLAAVSEVINQYIGINRADGGLITGPGTSDSDDVRVNASNGEFMMRAAAVRSIGVASLDRMNQTGRVPDMASIPAMRAAPINDNRELVAEMRALREENARLLRSLIGVTGGGLDRVASGTDRAGRTAEQAALVASRNASNRRRAA